MRIDDSVFFFLQICVQYCIDVVAVVEINVIQFINLHHNIIRRVAVRIATSLSQGQS